MKKTFNQQFKIRKQIGMPANTLKEIARKKAIEKKEERMREIYLSQIDQYEALTQIHQSI